jgi:hypothetical protein
VVVGATGGTVVCWLTKTIIDALSDVSDSTDAAGTWATTVMFFCFAPGITMLSTKLLQLSRKLPVSRDLAALRGTPRRLCIRCRGCRR